MKRYGNKKIVGITAAVYGQSYALREVFIGKYPRGTVGRRVHSDEWDFTPYTEAFQACQGMTLNEIANLLEDQEYRRING